jgi:Zn-dependent peptidase ImmA (M78 family)/transcriptional regulator with XRE-family HTH domain
MNDDQRLGLFPRPEPTPGQASRDFDPARLTQARLRAGLTKRAVADHLGVSAAAVGQYEAGIAKPRPDLLPKLGELFDVPLRYFLPGRPKAHLDTSMAHFRSLRRTPLHLRAKSVAHVEELWELIHALERRVHLPPIGLPGFASGELQPDALPGDPAAAAQALRIRWNLGATPIPHLIRLLESQGIVIAFLPLNETDDACVDAFSVSHLSRPIIVMTAERSNDVYRFRFSAAHELGHLVLHGDVRSGDSQQEREADRFAAEFLTPSGSITPRLPQRINFAVLTKLQAEWGVSVKSLITRYRELGRISGATVSRTYQRWNILREQGAFGDDPVQNHPSEIPTMLTRAFDIAAEHGLTMPDLADELAWPLSRVRFYLGIKDPRPKLALVPPEESPRGLTEQTANRSTAQTSPPPALIGVAPPA